jgi:hypothetical protein
MKLTRQGVRDLDSLPGKPAGHRPTPVAVAVPRAHVHGWTSTTDGRRVCLGCGAEQGEHLGDGTYAVKGEGRW